MSFIQSQKSCMSILFFGLASMLMIPLCIHSSDDIQTKISTLKTILTTLINKINADYKNQFNDFRKSNYKKIRSIVTDNYFKGNYGSDLIAIVNHSPNAKLKKAAEELNTLSIATFNAMRNIDAHLELYFNTSPKNESYKEIILDTLIPELSKHQQNINRILVNLPEDKMFRGIVNIFGSTFLNITRITNDHTLKILGTKPRGFFGRIFKK